MHFIDFWHDITTDSVILKIHMYFFKKIPGRLRVEIDDPADQPVLVVNLHF